MTDEFIDNPQDLLNEAAQEFVEAQLRGEQPDLDEFIKRWPGWEDRLRKKIHRDLKPGNVVVDADGNVKVLDFGIAKATQSPGDHTGSALTQHGHLLGTPAYMSPEQARGRPIDQRTDVWAFGCVLYELLTGRLAFEGETVSDTIAHVLERQPDWIALPGDLPCNIEVLLRRCLEKEPRDRLQHIGDAVLEIRETLDPPVVMPPVRVRGERMTRCRRIALMAFAPILLVLGSLLGIAIGRKVLPGKSASSQTPISFVIPHQTGYPGLSLYFPSLAISPDGKTLAYVAEDRDGRRRIFLRRFDQFDAHSLEGTEAAVSPFFSPDGQWIAYDDHHNRKLKKVAIGGGVPVTLAEAPDFRGGTWTADGHIIFAPDVRSGLYRIPASGGASEQITTPDSNAGEQAHLWPQILPGDRALLFTTSGRAPHVDVLQLSDGQRHRVLEGGGLARYDFAAHLLYGRDWSLYAVRFDVRRLTVEGPHRMVASEVWQSDVGTAQFAVAADGILAYVPGKWDTQKLQPVYVTRDGRRQPLPLPPRNYHQMCVSPDGAKVALFSPIGERRDIWVYDAVRGTATKITPDGKGYNPMWVKGDPHALYYQTPQGLSCWTREEEEPCHWGQIRNLRKMSHSSPDGRRLLVCLQDPNDFSGWHDLWTVDLADGNHPQPVVFERADHKQARAVWSPCGRWIAYDSDESGRHEIYVKPYPGPGSRILVSPDGGVEPLWSPDGAELYYRNRRKVVAARIETDPQFTVVGTEELFDDEYCSCILCKTYDMTPDGRFLMLHDPRGAEQMCIRVVVKHDASSP